MPINQPIEREAVRLLAIEIGLRPAARKLGLNEDTVCSWAKRETWFASPANPQTLQAPQAKPGDVLQATLQARKQESRAKLSEYQVRAATEAAAHREPLKITRQVNDLASIHAKVWPEEQTSGNSFSLNVLNLNMFSDDGA